MLATAALDGEIVATIEAIRSKNPQVYDDTAVFYKDELPEDKESTSRRSTAKPLYLHDYHKRNLLSGTLAEEVEEENQEAKLPSTYAQEQRALQDAIVDEINDVAQQEHAGNTAEDEFLLKKERSAKKTAARRNAPELDVKSADKDPEAFLSALMSSRMWATDPARGLEPFQSDDEEEEARADAFEDAYNRRFEDPERSNEKLLTHSRSVISKYSVRREEPSSRHKARSAKKTDDEGERRERETEKLRLRKLKMEEMEQKLQKIKDTAGLHAKVVKLDDWVNVLEGDWDDEQWNQEMEKKFGELYYADVDAVEDGAQQIGTEQSRRKGPKKPKWTDDIDIKDIIPDFVDDPATEGIKDIDQGDQTDDHETSHGVEGDKIRDKKEARLQRRQIQEIVDSSLDTEFAMSSVQAGKKSRAHSFRYRETSPSAYGLTARDILMADDAQLNEYAGLKKLATFRDPEKKTKDKKRLGKKGRLRQWRLQTFGNPDGPDVGDSKQVSNSNK